MSYDHERSRSFAVGQPAAAAAARLRLFWYDPGREVCNFR
jgi:hypothetical protein